MEAQIKQLKLNSINIKNTLFNKNKELKKLRLQERNLFNQQQSERKKEQRETALEAKGTGGGVLGSIGSRLLSGPMSLFDKIKEFFGNILLGILVNNLPKIYAAIQKFLDENKWLVQTIKEVIKFTGNAIMGFINVFNSAKDIIGELGDTVKKIESGLQELSDLANGIANQVSIFNNDVLGLGKEFEDEFKDVVKEDVIEAIKQSGGNGTPPITRRQFVKKSDEYRRAKSSGGITREIVVPGIGSYQRISPKGLFGMGEKEIAKDVSGMEIDPKEFDRRYNYMVGSQNEIFNTLRDEKIPGYSRGGTVKQQSSTGSGTKSFSGESAPARKARESTQSFVRFENNAIAQSEIIGIQEETNKSFEELIKNFKGLYREDKLPNISPFTLPTPDPKQQGPISPPPGTGSPSSPMIDKSGEPGVDFTPAGSNNRAVFAGEVVEIGHQYNPGKIGGDDRLGSGYGNYVVIRSEDPNNPGKYFDGLYAHFPDGEIKVSQGQKVQKGDILGRMATAAEYGNPKTRPRVGSGTGAHTSLDFLNPGSHLPYSNWRGLVPLVDTSFGSSNVKPKKAGGGRLNELSQSFDSSGGEVVMIMAQQPIIVPGPTRYITRTMTQVMPVAVPIAPKTSGLRELV